MKTSWDPIPDKWDVGLEAYYLTAGGARLGWVTSFSRPLSAVAALWSAGSFCDDGDTRWLGDYDTREAAMQAVEATVVPAHRQPGAPA